MYLEAVHEFVYAENALLELILEAAIPEIPDNVTNISEHLKRILKAVGKMTMLDDLVSAWRASKEALLNMEAAKKIYDSGISNLETSNRKLSALYRQLERECG